MVTPVALNWIDQPTDHLKPRIFPLYRNRGLKMPVVVLCPKNPDSLKFHLILRDIAKRLPRLDRATAKQLISYAVAGAGFSNVGQFMAKRRLIRKLSDLQVADQ